MSETGAFVITKGEFVQPDGRFGNSISIFETPKMQSVDIDTWQDWVLTESHMRRKNILFRVDGYDEIGTGHIYRTLLLAYNLTEHNVIFCLNRQSDVGIKKIKDSFFKYVVIDNDSELIDVIKENCIDIVVSDILNTSAEYMEILESTGVRTVNFEDLGYGSYKADAVVNALYEKQFENKNFFWGMDYYCIRDEFLITPRKQFTEKVSNVLVMFGGTDPCDLTWKLLNAIEELILYWFWSVQSRSAVYFA